jgi:dolichol-phosphate mannosyltransferase
MSEGPGGPALAVVIPVYNEEKNLGALLRDWQGVLGRIGAPYTIILIDDGSKDGSLRMLREMQEKDARLEVYSQPNAGHGPAILKGYRLGLLAEWVFQIDSDHQLDEGAFRTLWDNREGYDLLIGQRREKNASAARQVVSRLSTLMVRILVGGSVRDVNSPYRLMRAACLETALGKIPANSFAPNVLITSWFVRRKYRIFTTVVENRGEGQRFSRMSAYFLRGVLRSSLQTILFRLK